mmetsp:Transcript_70681/g.134568  ORF Transcript_70681/g.134568 Transcript_70681/m.134568 type:complete len:212 (-) Transcript_70681:26-661(-)
MSAILSRAGFTTRSTVGTETSSPPCLPLLIVACALSSCGAAIANGETIASTAVGLSSCGEAISEWVTLACAVASLSSSAKAGAGADTLVSGAPVVLAAASCTSAAASPVTASSGGGELWSPIALETACGESKATSPATTSSAPATSTSATPSAASCSAGSEAGDTLAAEASGGEGSGNDSAACSLTRFRRTSILACRFSRDPRSGCSGACN